MHAIKTSLRIVLLIFILSVVALVLYYVMGRIPARDATPAAPVEASQKLPITVETIRENGSSTPEITVEYPQFPSLSPAFNAEIRDAVMSRLQDFRDETRENYAARMATASESEKQYLHLSDFDFIARWEPAQVNARYVSFIIRFDSYTGGANGNQGLQTFNYDVAGKKDMAIADAFPNVSGLFGKLSAIARSQLAAKLKEAGGPDAPLDELAPGTAPVAENFKNFTFTDNAITIYFPKYSVAAGAFGEQKVVITRSEVK